LNIERRFFHGKNSKYGITWIITRL
jgi:hypothetical protein